MFSRSRSPSFSISLSFLHVRDLATDTSVRRSHFALVERSLLTSSFDVYTGVPQAAERLHPAREQFNLISAFWCRTTECYTLDKHQSQLLRWVFICDSRATLYFIVRRMLSASLLRGIIIIYCRNYHIFLLWIIGAIIWKVGTWNLRQKKDNEKSERTFTDYFTLYHENCLRGLLLSSTIFLSLSLSLSFLFLPP